MNWRVFPTEFLVLLRSFTLTAGLLVWLTGLPAFGQNSCVNFPANYVPFASVSYVTAPNAAGDRLVVGPLGAGGFSTFANTIPLPSFINQEFCDAQVQLAPQQSYPNVYVPTAAERAGDFSAFSGLLINPATNQPYPNGIIPASQLGNPYAMRIAPNALSITGVENAASIIVPGLPNSGIAQGSIFIVKGTGLGPASLSIASAPFQSTSLDGTSVAVTVGGSTVNALMYYTSAAQVAALLPSNTLTGTGTITVTYNNQVSAQVPVTVVANNLGIFTIDSSGAGPGIVTYADYSLVSAVKATNCGGPNTTCGAANAGDTLILWATGLGPVTGSDASGAGLGQAINVPLTLWLGGVQAPVVYQGRSGCCVGEDQIVFTVPNDVPTGCAVPLLVQIGNEISNNTVMPVANGSRNCTPSNAALASINVEQAVLAGPVGYGSITLNHSSDGGGKFEDDAKATFVSIPTYVPGSQPFFDSWVDDQPVGTCIVYNNLNESGGVGPVASMAALDAGSTIVVQGSAGSVSVPINQHGQSQISANGTFLAPGAYTVTGTGGVVGPFSASITIPALPTLISPVNNATVTRSNGMTVTWTGGSGNAVMEVFGCTDNTCNNGASAVCTAPASAGTFAIPPYVLLALPASNSGGFVFSTVTPKVPFMATDLTVGILSIGRYNDAGFGYGWSSGSFALK